RPAAHRDSLFRVQDHGGVRARDARASVVWDLRVPQRRHREAKHAPAANVPELPAPLHRDSDRLVLRRSGTTALDGVWGAANGRGDNAVAHNAQCVDLADRLHGAIHADLCVRCLLYLSTDPFRTTWEACDSHPSVAESS